jgi:S-DNA-T family DNA segregation ATPase FtsK/SpoIIIE
VLRSLRVHCNRAARLIEAMERAGLVSAMNGAGGREVIAPARSE